MRRTFNKEREKMERRKKREERRSKGEKQKEKSMQGRRRDECAEIRVQQSQYGGSFP